MPFTYENQMTIEKSPAYLKNADPRVVYETVPNVKLIVIIRNPVKRAISQFSHYINTKNISFDPNRYDNVSHYFDTSVYENGTLPINGTISLHYWIASGAYSLHLKRWLKYFPIEQFLFLNGESFIRNPYEEVKKAEKFLNLRPFITKEHFFFNKQKGFYCVYKDLKNKERRCMGSSKGRKHPFVSQKTVNNLYKFFYPYNIELFQMLNQTPFWDL